MYRLGIDIGGTNIAAGLIGDDLRLLCKKSVPFPKGQTAELIVPIVTGLMNGLCATAGIAPSELESVGLAVPGSIDRAGCNVISAYNLGYFNFPLRDLVQSVCPVPVRIVNDANAAALAELVCGTLAGCTTAVLVTLGTGVGGGLILGGRMFNGGLNQGVELGHMFLKSGGVPCSCGQKGCMECYCSATRLVREGAAFGYGDAKAVIDAARTGEPNAVRLFADYIDDLGSGLASIVNLIDPERIAIGGGIAGAGEFLLAPLRENLRGKVFFPDCPQLVCAKMGNDAGIVGAAMLYGNER